MNKYVIYKATNKINNKSYIGFDSNWPKRQQDHKRMAEKGSSAAFHGAIRKWKWDNFEWSIIFSSDEKDYTKNVMEEHFIRTHKTHVNDNTGYNMTYGGDGLLNPDEETRWKIGTANRGKKRGSPSEETKRKIGLANSKKKRTEKEKQHLRQLNLGKKHSEETILKKSKYYIATSPDGIVYTFYNLNRFCKENNLSQAAMSKVAKGSHSQHLGWKCQFDYSKMNKEE